MIKQFNYPLRQISNNFDLSTFNESGISIVDTFTVKKTKHLIPYFLLQYHLKKKYNIFNRYSNNVLPMTKLRVHQQFIIFRESFAIFSTTTFPTVEYYFNKGIIRDANNNTLICICVDSSKINNKDKKIEDKGLYLMMNSSLLSLPEHKKLLSIINSKDGIYQEFIANGFDVIQTSNIDNKLFDTIDIVFSSIGDRKKYFQEKVEQLKEETLSTIDKIEVIVQLKEQSVAF